MAKAINDKLVTTMKKINFSLFNLVKSFSSILCIIINRCFSVIKSIFQKVSIKMSLNSQYNFVVKWYVIITTTIFLRLLFAPRVSCEEKKDPSFSEKYLYWVDTKTVVIITLIIVSGVLLYRYNDKVTALEESDGMVEKLNQDILDSATKISLLEAELKSQEDRMEYEKGVGFSLGVEYQKNYYQNLVRQKSVDAYQKGFYQGQQIKDKDAYQNAFEAGVDFQKRQQNNAVEFNRNNVFNENQNFGTINDVTITFSPDLPIYP